MLTEKIVGAPDFPVVDEGRREARDDIDGWEQLSPIVGTPLMRTGLSQPDTEGQVLNLLREYFPDWQEPV